MDKAIIAAGIAALLAIGIHGRMETRRICGDAANYAACDLSLQAWGDETRARNAGFGIYN
jgi:hypothetical protein